MLGSSQLIYYGKKSEGYVEGKWKGGEEKGE